MDTPTESSSGQKESWRARRLDAGALEGARSLGASEAPSWRGWALGLSGVVLLAWLTPVVEYGYGRLFVSVNLLPMASLFLLLALAGLNLAVRAARGRLGLRSQDLALFTIMTMVAAAVPGYGFVSFLIGVLSNGSFYARPENGWREAIVAHQPAWLVPHDPVDPASLDPRPIEWLMTGLPPGASIPWLAWLGPYLWWALMAVFVYGMLYALCALLWKQWHVHERLPFPLAQVPEALIAGAKTDEGRVPFLKHRLAWIGMGFSLALLSWNHLEEFYPGWPAVALRFNPSSFLREPPWLGLNPLFMNFAPSMLGLAFLLPMEISFSLWFFYLVVQKACVQLAAQAGLGQTGWDFYETGGHRGFLLDQGAGALWAFVLFGLWMARRHLKDVWRRAWSAGDEASAYEPLSPRAALVMMSLCALGALVWLRAAGVGLGPALLGLAVFNVVTLGMTRLSCEGGLFDIQTRVSAMDTLNQVFTPVGLGAQGLVAVSMWNRAFAFDWGRTSPMPAMMNGLYLAGELRLRRRTVAWGVGVALLLALGIGYASTLATIFGSDGGVSSLANRWGLTGAAQGDYERVAHQVQRIEYYEKLKREQGSALKADQIPDEAKRDTLRFFWSGLGFGVALALAAVRTVWLWAPHPIGYVMWMHPRTMQEYWFPILVGWFFKWAVSKYGGMKVYRSVKYLFIGLVVGEAAAAGLWLAIFKLAGKY
ncbi:MAG: hypothetical protein M5U26_12295 [Planctomycetota bacterium]|nr:hypothetical protein [Planctomycetota bacterium]